jgi:hypothetical protein
VIPVPGPIRIKQLWLINVFVDLSKDTSRRNDETAGYRRRADAAHFHGGACPGKSLLQGGYPKVDIEINGQPLATFHYEDTWLKPFLQAVRSASGTIVTRGYPFDKIAGESNDHFWHHGIWYGHGDINGIDFWREFTGNATEDAKFKLPIGRFVIKGKPQLKMSRESGSLSAAFDLMRADKTSLGTIREVFTFRRSGNDNVIDAEITVSADRGVALKMGDTEEGSLGLRFADEFKEDRGAILTNSDGLKGAANIWGKRARWVDYSTSIKGEQLGVSIFDHPKNPKHPPSGTHAVTASAESIHLVSTISLTTRSVMAA